MQLGRGDSFPTSTIEAAAAGVPVFVSEETGTKELLQKIDPYFITNLLAKDISCKIIEYLKIPNYEKNIISAKFKQVALTYTEENANSLFLKVFAEIGKD
jgi:glycosyltransferase involved in cell wall biosynthesis